MYNKINMENILTDKLLKHYNLVNDMINKIFATITTADNIDKIIENFERTTIRYARELKNQGYVTEAGLYLAVCAKFSYLLDKTDELILHENYIRELFKRLDYLICIKAMKT